MLNQLVCKASQHFFAHLCQSDGMLLYVPVVGLAADTACAYCIKHRCVLRRVASPFANNVDEQYGKIKHENGKTA